MVTLSKFGSTLVCGEHLLYGRSDVARSCQPREGRQKSLCDFYFHPCTNYTGAPPWFWGFYRRPEEDASSLHVREDKARNYGPEIEQWLSYRFRRAGRNHDMLCTCCSSGDLLLKRQGPMICSHGRISQVELRVLFE